MSSLIEAIHEAQRNIQINEHSGHRWVLRDQKIRELASSPLPIMTAAVIGTQREYTDTFPLVMSRAHLSQAVAFAQIYEADNPLPVADLANFLEDDSLHKMIGTAIKGRLIARNDITSLAYKAATPILRKLLPLDKGFRDVAASFTEGLKMRAGQPMVTFHYGVANTVIDHLRKNKIKNIPVIHYMSDPYVHEAYLKHKNLPFVYYFVFNQKTADSLVKSGVSKERVFVTGFPVNHDLEIGNNLEDYKYQPGKKLRVGVFTGGVGTNQDEILEMAKGFDYDRQQAVFYCGTNIDLADKLRAELTGKKISPVLITDDTNFEARKDDKAIIVVDNNLGSLLPVSYRIMNWSQIVATKPSGDLGIEALISGKPVIFFKDWGKHETEIRKIIREYEGQLEILDGYQSIGFDLNLLQATLSLYEKVRNLRAKLEENPPFPKNWQEKAIEALDVIKTKFGST